MSEADPRGAAASGARLEERARVAQVATTPGHFLTFSVGVASCPDDAVSPEELIMAADQALYQAKRDGKDRVMSCGELVDRLRSDDDAVLSALAESGPQVMIAIAHTVDSRDPRTRGRSTRVAAIAEELAKQAGVPDSDLDELRTVALLHDVGLLEISPELACHDWPLTHGDADLVLRHAELGEQIVSGGQFPPQVANAVRHHHERWDGQGYPDHLAGRRIPLPARIVALSDALESVLSSRRGGEPPSLIEAFERLSPEAGRAFDPNLVDALRNVIAQGRLGSLALRSLEPALNTGA
jgi:putative nucleotidyltransferase with HDIG domain